MRIPYPSQEELHQVFDYDPDTGVFRWKINTSKTNRIGKIAGSPIKDGYIAIRYKGKNYQAHRLAWIYMKGEFDPILFVDHKNGVTSDNWIGNLRLATHPQNARNMRLNKNSTTGVKGVRWKPQDKRFIAQCKVNGKQHHVGSFKTIEAAESAMRAFREKVHGEFANHG